jgi:hypothetical protein
VVLFVLVFIFHWRLLITSLVSSNVSFRTINRIGGVMVSVLAKSAVDHEFEPDRVKPKTIKLVCVASPLITYN